MGGKPVADLSTHIYRIPAGHLHCIQTEEPVDKRTDSFFLDGNTVRPAVDINHPSADSRAEHDTPPITLLFVAQQKVVDLVPGCSYIYRFCFFRSRLWEFCL